MQLFKTVHCGVVTDCYCVWFCRVLRLGKGEAREVLADYNGPRYEIERRHAMVVNPYLVHA